MVTWCLSLTQAHSHLSQVNSKQDPNDQERESSLKNKDVRALEKFETLDG